MAMDFPANPTVDDVFTDAASGATYTWNGYAWAKSSSSGPIGTPSDYVLKAGDVMTGFLTLNADPVQPLHAATKRYADTKGLPTGGTVGQTLALDSVGVPNWGNTVDAGNF
jgi:hypothetical protein